MLTFKLGDNSFINSYYDIKHLLQKCDEVRSALERSVTRYREVGDLRILHRTKTKVLAAGVIYMLKTEYVYRTSENLRLFSSLHKNSPKTEKNALQIIILEAQGVPQ